MDIDTNKMQKFIDAVNDEIDIQVSELLKEAEEEKKHIIELAKTESEVTAEKHMTAVHKKTGNQYVREVSKAELDMKREVQKHRESLSKKVFAQAVKKISEYRNTNQYADGLVKTLLLMNINDNVEIRLSSQDMKYAEILKKVVKTEDITFVSDETIKQGGLSVYSKNKGTIVDKTFDLAVEEQKTIFVNSNAFAV